MDSKGTQLYMYMYPFSPKLPSHPGCHITVSASLYPSSLKLAPCVEATVVVPSPSHFLALMGWWVGEYTARENVCCAVLSDT